jgi:predicted DNA-binding transcriptional regulator AlpA
MKLTTDLLTLSEVAVHFMISESSVRRKVRLAREGACNFPMPIFARNCSLRWKRSDIENWDGENSVIEFTPSLSLPTYPTAQVKSRNQTHRELKSKHGIDVSPQRNNDTDG